MTIALGMFAGLLAEALIVSLSTWLLLHGVNRPTGEARL